MKKAPDRSIFDLAVKESRVVITLDRDFPQILATQSAHRPSVVFIRLQNLKGPDLVALIESVWADHESALEQGCLVKVSSKGTKVRLLPLR